MLSPCPFKTQVVNFGLFGHVEDVCLAELTA